MTRTNPAGINSQAKNSVKLTAPANKTMRNCLMFRILLRNNSFFLRSKLDEKDTWVSIIYEPTNYDQFRHYLFVVLLDDLV